ncbi:MAG: hypothetical protein RIR86_2862 [Acidobacteriota bacterium]
MRILITGATGVIGKALTERLQSGGHEIRILSRRAGTNGSNSRGVTAWRWDPERELPPAAALDGVDAVVHLAGEPVASGRWNPELKRRIRDSRVIGTRKLVEGLAAMARPPAVLVGASAVGYFGDRGEEQLDETAPPGLGYLSEVCQEWEAEYRRAESAGIRVAMVRIGVVLSREGGALEKMLLPFKLGLGGRLGSGQQWFPWIHIDDIVGLFETAILNSQLSGVLNGAAPESVTNEHFTRSLAAALHRPVFLPVPTPAIRLLVGEMAAVVLASQRVVPAVALSAGYQFRFPQIDSALRDLLEKR